jgi:hypothetical protein
MVTTIQRSWVSWKLPGQSFFSPRNHHAVRRLQTKLATCRRIVNLTRLTPQLTLGSWTHNLGSWKVPNFVALLSAIYFGKAIINHRTIITIHECYKGYKPLKKKTGGLLLLSNIITLLCGPGIWKYHVHVWTEIEIIHQPEMKSFCEASPYWTSLKCWGPSDVLLVIINDNSW